ncbi:hypothetical protein HUJ05_012232 [Dendroctonus ponderosae]|nr:hypothetical protein HUJ05_012232 [Dendroctonus ponderosae]
MLVLKSLKLIKTELDQDIFKQQLNTFCQDLLIDNDTGSEIGSVAGTMSDVIISDDGFGENKPAVRLPPITLPTFNGKYCSWLAFKDTYLSLGDKN